MARLLQASLVKMTDVEAENKTVGWERHCTTQVMVQAPKNRAMPLHFVETVRAKKMPIQVCASERMLLNFLFAQVGKFDADVLVAHNLVVRITSWHMRICA